MSQINQINLENNALHQLGQQPGGAGGNNVNVQQPAQQPAQADPNAAALAHLSDTDRAAAEMFLRGASVQEAAKHTKWSLATKIITGIFTFGIAPAIMCRKEAAKERQLAADAVSLKDAMNQMAGKEHAAVMNVRMDGQYLPVVRAEDGTLSTTIGGQTIVSKFPPKVLAEIIENDIVANSDLYGTQAALDVLGGAKRPGGGQAAETGHAGQSLQEQFDKAMTKCTQRIGKAEAAVSADATARAAKQELDAAENALAQLQAEYDKTEARCNQTLLNCKENLASADKARQLLTAAQGEGGNVDGLIKEIDGKRNAILAEKTKAEAELLHLRTETRAALDTAGIRRDAALLAARENALCKGLLDAYQERDKLTSSHAQNMQKISTRLHELEASPERNTPAVQSEIHALRLVLAAPQKQGGPQADPLELNPGNPADALDSKGLNDARLREICLKAIKAKMGIDGGELHSCPTRYLNRIAQYAIEGYYGSAKNLIDHVLKISTTSRIASEDVMELMDVRRQDANTGQKVNVAVLRPPVNRFATATQRQVANFAADIIYSGNIVDEDRLSSEDRLRKVLQSNASVIGDVLKVEAGLNAVDLEAKAREAEQNAARPEATEADKLAAKAARAEANAAQFEAKTLRGSNIEKGISKSIGKFFSLFGAGPEKPDEAQFTGLEAQAYAAEARMLRERNPLALRVAQAQAEVEEHEDDPARLAELTDAQKALEDFDRNSDIVQDAIAARLAVRLARAEAQAKLSGSEDDQKKADDLRNAIEDAKPGVPDAGLGAEFDVPADTALEKRLASRDDLPEAERASLLDALPPEMADAVKEMMGDMRTALVGENKHADTVSIGYGITQLEDKDLRTIVRQVNESVNKAAQMVQEEMTTAILMMDATLSVPTKAALRELKAVMEAEHLPLTQESAEALLARKPQPQAVAAALETLANAITGVDDPAQRRLLAGKVAVNQFAEYARLADNARQAQETAARAAENATNAFHYENECQIRCNTTLHEVTNADDVWKARQTQASQSRTAAEQAETTAHNAEVTAQSLESAFAAQPQNAREALRLESAASQAENRAASLEDAAAKARDAADEAELLTLVAGAPADAPEKARAAREAANEAAAAAASARAEATQARNAANAAVQAVDPQVLADARTAQQAAADARANATQARQQADAARATADQHQAEVNTAKGAFDDASAAHSVNVQAHLEAQTAKAQTEAAKVKAQTEAQAAQAEAEAALAVNHEGQPVEAAGGNAPANAPANAEQAHQLRLAQLQATDLNTLVASAGTDFSSDGLGKFVKFVIQDYFQSVPLMDKRSMVSAGLRYAPANATAMQKLGAMLKGAGPVLQKIFQGLDGPGLPQDLRIACQDMKSRLAPIPPDIVEANLLDMVNSSNGRIRNIEVLSSLGAASVGQAFRCRITDQNGQARECVVKILRPDAPNRVQRERPIFEKAAAKVPGMLGTFRGQMEGIIEELDFGIEAGNAKAGVVYDKPFDGQERSIQSVKVVEDIPPKGNSMAMEMAPGTTLDGFLRDTREEIARMGQNLGRTEEFDALGQRSRVVYEVPEGRLNELDPVKARLQELYDQAAARHKQLTALADVWVTEGIFGEQGFFHGDLHAGNIMSDGKKLTVIDFGNATKLTQEQQSSVMTMIVATTTRQSSKFLDAFRSMLPPQAQAVFDNKKQQILESVRVIMQKGDMGDTGGRIAAILGEIQRNGVEIPHAIFNFSGSQIRLANSINEMITLMNHISEEMRAIDTIRSQNFPEILPFDRSINHTVMAAMADENQTHQSVMGYIDSYIAQIQDENSELNQEQEQDVRTALSFPSFLVDFKAKNVDKDPTLLAVWNQHKDALENTTHPQHDAAVNEIIRALRTKALNTLNALKAEEQKDHSRRASPETFLDVMSDVVETNKSGATKKLGLASSVKYGITSFIHDNITERVQPKI
ncbi:MAG: hypothetical protein E7022_10465 [Desulfovibrio desulfuricans]|nr:hypothetical protein [Desulfovibrio desulfuricans]